MKYKKSYESVRFSAEVIREASNVFRRQVDPENRTPSKFTLRVDVDNAEWRHDSLEEFFADFRRSDFGAYYKEEVAIWNELSVMVIRRPYEDLHEVTTIVEVSAADRTKISAVMDVFEKNVPASRVPEPPPPPSAPPTSPIVFIGHGHAEEWRDLKDHLQDQHNYEVVAYEIGTRAGHEVRDILEEMLFASSFAVLVLTGEDRTEGGDLHPRLNVVHELGLFQGRLGFRRAIVLLEEGTTEFSNINGVHQIRFAKGNIRETFGDVLATLNREVSRPTP